MVDLKLLTQKIILLVGAFLLTSPFLKVELGQPFAYAESPSSFSLCTELEKCIKTVSEITGDKYIFNADLLKGKMNVSDNVELTQENATFLLSQALYFNGYTRIPLGHPHTYRITSHSNALHIPLPIVFATTDTPPEFPNTWDLITLTYQVKYPEVIREMANTARSFMHASARIVPNKITSQIILTDTAVNIKNVYKILREMDQKPNKKLQEEMDHSPRSYNSNGFEKF